MYLLGLDVGTSGCKAAVFSDNGETITHAYNEYDLIYPQKGWMELDPEDVTSAVFDCIKKCSSEGHGPDIEAIAVSTQGEAVIPVGTDGKPLANSIVTFDNRNIEEYKWFDNKFDKYETMKITGAPLHTMTTVLKILWIKNNMRKIYDKTWKFMCFGDYISYRLGAEPACCQSPNLRLKAIFFSLYLRLCLV